MAELTPEQVAAVEAAGEAARARAAAQDAYIDAVVAARVAGAPVSVIAAATGTSGEAVRKMVNKYATVELVVTPAGRPRKAG